MVKIGVSLYGFSHKSNIKENLIDISSIGFDTVVLAVSENDLKHFERNVSYSVRIAKERGLEVFIDLWGFGSSFGGEAASHFLAEHPESRQVTNKGKYVPMACLSNDLFRRYLLGAIKDLSKSRPNGFFFDEPHFFYDKLKGEYACLCGDCKKFFFKRNGRKIISKKDLWNNKNEIILETISMLTKKADSFGIKSSVCIFPKERDNSYSWNDICKISSVDIFGVDPYWNDPYWKRFFQKKPEFAGKIAREVAKLSNINGKESEIWIQAFGIPSRKESEIEKAVKSVLATDVDRIMFWTYKCGDGSSVSSENPEKCWNAVLNSVKIIKKGEIKT